MTSGGHAEANPQEGQGDPGVRRHLAVILASAGDRAAVAVLASQDPCEYVRASALRLMLQIATPGAQSAVVSHLLEIARADPSAHVRSESLRLISSAHHRPPVEHVAHCLEDPALSVRSAAADFLLELATDDGVVDLLAEAASAEVDPDERTRLWCRLSDLGRADVALRAASSSAPGHDQVVAALDVLIHAKQKLPWGSLAWLADRCEAGIDRRLFQLLADPTTASLPFLLSRAVAGLRPTEPEPRSRADHDVRHVGFRSLYALAGIAPFGRVALSPHPGAAESVRWLVDTLGAHVEDLRRTYPSDEDWLEYEVAELEELRSRLSGLIEEGPRDRAAGPDASSE